MKKNGPCDASAGSIFKIDDKPGPAPLRLTISRDGHLGCFLCSGDVVPELSVSAQPRNSRRCFRTGSDRKRQIKTAEPKRNREGEASTLKSPEGRDAQRSEPEQDQAREHMETDLATR